MFVYARLMPCVFSDYCEACGEEVPALRIFPRARSSFFGAKRIVFWRQTHCFEVTRARSMY